MSHAIRTARTDELDAVLDAYGWLFAAPGSQPAGWDLGRARETLEWSIAAATATVLVADRDGALVGFATVVLDLRSVRFGQRAWVEDLAVDPEWRSVGVGKALLDAAKGWARERGATHLELDSGNARSDAHRFYEREQLSWTSRCFAWSL